MSKFKSVLKRVLETQGYIIAKQIKKSGGGLPLELTKDEGEIIEDVLDNKLTMVPVEGLVCTLLSVKYVLENDIKGDFVECGVWRGGNAIIAAQMIKKYESSKHCWLFDTFSGMTAPSKVDTPTRGNFSVHEYYNSQSKKIKGEEINLWCYASKEEVSKNFFDRNLLHENIHFVKGDVLTTLKKNFQPNEISVLRLDTDWYESTKVELETLWPKIVTGGCLIVDDYGYWTGSKKAVDEYFKSLQYKPLLNVINKNIRIGVKTIQAH